MNELAEWVALSLVPGLGGRTIRRLLDHFGSLGAVLAAGNADLQAVRGIGPRLAAAIAEVDVARTQGEIAAWQAAGIAVLLHSDPAYPAALRALDDAPPVLFARGAGWDSAHAAAIVGTRRPHPESQRIAAALAGALAAQGWAVISGLAAGIDTAAHTGALESGGVTLAVLGCGVRVAYPPENRPLAARIVTQGGGLLSEVHPDAAPGSPALVARNRVISGLSRAVIVIETGESGGSLHAARFAQAQGRPVYVINSDAPGNRRLIADGARPLPPAGAAEALLADFRS